MDIEMTDDELLEVARSASPSELLETLEKASKFDDDTQAAARAARRRLNLLITVGLERADVNNRRMAERTGIKERDLYKRPSRL